MPELESQPAPAQPVGPPRKRRPDAESRIKQLLTENRRLKDRIADLEAIPAETWRNHKPAFGEDQNMLPASVVEERAAELVREIREAEKRERRLTAYRAGRDGLPQAQLEAAERMTVSDVIRDAIVAAGQLGPRVILYLYENQEVLASLQALPMVDQAVAIGRLVQQLDGCTAPVARNVADLYRQTKARLGA